MTSNSPIFGSALPTQEPIRIVPPYRPDVLRAPTAPAHLIYNNGPVLTAVQVFTIFWGTDWQQSPLSDTAQNLNAFFDAILTSQLMDNLAEYSTPQQQIGHGSRIGTITLTTALPGTTVDDSAIQQMINDGIANNPAFPQPTANTLYFVYLPSGVAVTQGGQSSCQAFCGYHDAINSQIFYAVMPYPDCSGCTGGTSSNLAPFDALTGTSSHELCEAITDPVPGGGWYDQTNGEIGDICAWQFEHIAGYTVQKEWSNQANACI